MTSDGGNTQEDKSLSEDDDKLVTLVQAASLLEIPYITAYQQVRWGYLHATLVRNRYMVHTSDVERFRTDGSHRRHKRMRSGYARPKTAPTPSAPAPNDEA